MSDPFPTTHWSLVLAARQGDDTRSREALAALCEAYWFPLYVYVRGRGQDADEALDMTQAYFVQLIEKRFLEAVAPYTGRFRAFLLHTMKHFLSNEWARARAKRRGGDSTILPFEIQGAEQRYGASVADSATPEREFERQWARTIVDRVFERLEREAEKHGDASRFRLLRGYLTDEPGTRPYAETARDLGISETGVKSAVHRLRKRFGVLLRGEIAHTVVDPDEIDDEIQHLFAALE